MSESVSKPLTQAEDLFKSLVWTPMVRAGETWLEGVAPALALPVLRQLTEAEIELVTNWCFDQLRMFVDITAIKFMNAAHQSAYDQASLELAIIAQEKGIDSDDFKKAREVAAAAFSQFIRVNR